MICVACFLFFYFVTDVDMAAQKRCARCVRIEALSDNDSRLLSTSVVIGNVARS